MEMNKDLTIYINTVRHGPDTENVFQVMWYYDDDALSAESTFCRGADELKTLIASIYAL